MDAGEEIMLGSGAMILANEILLGLETHQMWKRHIPDTDFTEFVERNFQNVDKEKLQRIVST